MVAELAKALVVLGGLALGALQPESAGTSSSSGSGSGGGNLTTNASNLEFLCYSGQVATFVALKALLRSGDRFALSSGNWGAAPSAPSIDSWLASLEGAVSGLAFSGHTGGQTNVEKLVPLVSSKVTSWDLDYEPNEPGFSADGETTYLNLVKFADYVRGKGKKAVAYLTGRGFGFHPNWNYGTLAKAVDRVIVQTQGAVAGGTGPSLLADILDQFKSEGESPSKLTVQATIGLRSTTNDQVVEMYEASSKAGCDSFFIEFAGAQSGLESLLKALGR